MTFSIDQFPVTAVDELSKQGVPDVSRLLPTPNPTFKALSELATQLKGAVVMGHSQSGPFPLETALLAPTATKGLVLVEPGRCPDTYTDQQIATLARVPVLVVFGDHRDTPTGLPTLPTWQARYEACQAMIGRLMLRACGARDLSARPRCVASTVVATTSTAATRTARTTREPVKCTEPSLRPRYAVPNGGVTTRTRG